MIDGKLTELEQTKMELFALRHQFLQQQLNANLLNRAAMIEQIELAHPGYKWDEPTGRLAPVPPAVE